MNAWSSTETHGGTETDHHAGAAHEGKLAVVESNFAHVVGGARLPQQRGHEGREEFQKYFLTLIFADAYTGALYGTDTIRVALNKMG